MLKSCVWKIILFADFYEIVVRIRSHFLISLARTEDATVTKRERCLRDNGDTCIIIISIFCAFHQSIYIY